MSLLEKNERFLLEEIVKKNFAANTKTVFWEFFGLFLNHYY